jgi:cystathionine beta-lyase
MNVLSMYALIGAYQQEGYEWTDELCKVLTKNAEYAYDYIRSHFKGVQVAMPQGTYMLLLDCTEWCRKHGITIDELQKRGPPLWRFAVYPLFALLLVDSDLKSLFA